MATISSRLDRLEQTLCPSAPKQFVSAVMSFDDRGNCSELELCGQKFAALAGESEEDLCARAKSVTGTANLILIQLIPAANGALLPGFERFAK